MPGPADYLKQDPSSEEVDPESTHLMKATQRPKNSSMFSSTSKRLYVPPAIVAVSWMSNYAEHVYTYLSLLCIS